MTTQASVIPQSDEQEQFQTARVIPIVGAHFIQDLYTSCVAPLLPLFIEKFSLSLTQAGALTAALQIPAVLNPFIGYLADKVSLRYFVIFAPAVTATLVGLMGLAPGYFALILLLFTAGVSVAAFHAPSPAMVARVSGKQVGLGMSLYMSGGAAAYAVGPLMAVWAVSTWTLEGFWRTAVLGWGATVILYIRLSGLSARPEIEPGSLRVILPQVVSFFLPLTLYTLFGFPLLECRLHRAGYAGCRGSGRDIHLASTSCLLRGCQSGEWGQRRAFSSGELRRGCDEFSARSGYGQGRGNTGGPSDKHG